MKDDIKRFWDSTIPGENGCLLWNRTTAPTKSGRRAKFALTSPRRKVWATRWIMEQTLGENFKKELMVCHTCDVPLCVNTEHLFQGTAKENFDDMVAKGRGTGFLLGHDCVTRRLTEDQVREMRDLYAGLHSETEFGRPKVYGMGRLSRKFGVTEGTVQSIVRRDTWKHI
jgi:HNH endonuclease